MALPVNPGVQLYDASGACGADLSEIARRIDVRGRIAPLHAVEQIECVNPDLKSGSFFVYRDVFEDRDVLVKQAA